MIHIRPAVRAEIDWINERYDEVEFVHSNFENEVIAVAEVDGQKAGIGRIVTIDNENLELGGMFVFEAFRGRGVGKKIVEFLLKQTLPSQTIYCIPFEHLTELYKQCGFETCKDLEHAPPAVLEKYRWCKKKYPQPTSLLIMNEKPK